MAKIKNFIRTYGAMTLVVTALVLMMGIVDSISFFNMVSGFSHSLPLGDVLTTTFLPWLLWVPFAPMVAFIGQRFRPPVASWKWVTVAHVSAGAVTGFAAATLSVQRPPIVFGNEEGRCSNCEEIFAGVPAESVTIEMFTSMPEEIPEDLAEVIGKRLSGFVVSDAGTPWFGPFVSGFLTYAILAIVVMALQLYREVRQRREMAERLQGQLVQAQLSTLRMQIRPHFLFNTLNSIATLMPRDIDSARRVLNRLADLLRASFGEIHHHETALRSEMDLLRGYLEIEQARFGDKLGINISVDPDTVESLVPTFCLQPLVENAIVHGIGNRPELGTIQVRAARDGDHVFIEVSDDGTGLSGDKPSGRGIGLTNTRERLRQLYGDEAKLTLETPEAGGLTVRLRIPYHETPVHVTDA